ncbi:DUF1801 domain-containing protein [Aureitalea sp. L0-47]|uniref:DUF1801 domain-containing protein n=1 Tax=Aureitalea sp. L0-47 TaxID=2816962 RepID=UPI00223832A5|nr:DUF1801 domain-containing protein [Aureitalea sp. L0-47]MCW5520708.1 DUF1801 domain-containing protein [Aureitalea sp. L0-47]
MKPAEEYILNAKEPFRSIMLHLQMVIESTLTDLELLYKWRLPFYYIEGKQGLCYFNQSKNYVDLGFWHGAHLTVHRDKLVSENRKHMKSLRYFKLEDVDDEVLIDVLKEAYSVRDRKYYK